MYLRRACELAARGRGNTSPNPCVGAVIVREGRTLGEGFHHVRGAAHAEIEALRAAGDDTRAATMYVTLEPCDHRGLTPPCSEALVTAGMTRVVVGAVDVNPKTCGRGIARLRTAGVDVELVDDPWARALVDDFSVAITRQRPYVTLKLASSLDGFVAPQPGPHWLTGDAARAFVRDLRATHDAVLVGAGTVAADDPRLTVRPPRSRRRNAVRVVAADRAPWPRERRIFSKVDGYDPTLVLLPSGFAAMAEGDATLAGEIVPIGEPDARELDLTAALHALYARGIGSVLCEGGPRLATRLLQAQLVDRLEWLIAPQVLGSRTAVPALAGATLASVANGRCFERVERLGDDLRLAMRF